MQNLERLPTMLARKIEAQGAQAFETSLHSAAVQGTHLAACNLFRGCHLGAGRTLRIASGGLTSGRRNCIHAGCTRWRRPLLYGFYMEQVHDAGSKVLDDFVVQFKIVA